jgi:predicted O-methyltransferase YrrM
MIKEIASSLLLSRAVKPWLDRICCHYYYTDLDKKSEYYQTARAALAKKLNLFTGGLNPGDADALELLASVVRRPGGELSIIEVGSWTGLSTSILARVARRGKGGIVISVDHWKGNNGTTLGEKIKGVEALSLFRETIREQGLEEVVYPFITDSAIAARVIRDQVADLVFIDADHKYVPFRWDLALWLRKVRPGGIICGHDCEDYYSLLTERGQEDIDRSLNLEYRSDIHQHPGVIRGLWTTFRDDYSIMPDSSVWYKVVQ